MRSSPNVIYRLLHKDYAESFAAYAPRKTDFYDVITSQLPESWSIQRQDIWFYCSSPQQTIPLQGWKIHVSSTLRDSSEVLGRVASVLFQHKDISFKFAADRSLLSLLNSKSWPRGASGKFITVYPPDNSRFLDLIEELDKATEGMQGPYILSDHRYKDSNVLFFRFGGMRLYDVLNVKGERTPMLVAPDGTKLSKRRHGPTVSVTTYRDAGFVAQGKRMSAIRSGSVVSETIDMLGHHLREHRQGKFRATLGAH